MRRLRSIIVVAAMAVGVLTAPTTAAAQRCSGDDVAAIDQYCELLPSAEGLTPTDEPHRGLGTVLTQTQRVQLWRAGPTGRALLAMPTGARLTDHGTKVQPLPGAAAALSGSLATAERPTKNPVRAIGDAAWDGERLSELFRWLLLMSTVGLVGTAWMRRGR